MLFDLVTGTCPKIVDMEIWSKGCRRRVETFHNQVMPLESRSFEESSLEYSGNYIVEVVRSQSYLKERGCVEGG